MPIIILIIGISVLILIHEYGHFLAAKRFGLLVEEFGIGFPPRLFSKKIGETVWSINALPFGGFVRIYGEHPELEKDTASVNTSRSFAHLTIGRRALIIGAGVVMNFVLGWILISGVYMVGVPHHVVIADVGADTPAAVAGVLPGDALAEFSSAESFIAYVEEHKGEEIALSIKRDGETLAIPLTPRVVVPEGEGALGISLVESGQDPLSFMASIGKGFMASVGILWAILASLWTLLVGLFSGAGVADNFVGPVGIFQIATESAQFGLARLFQLIGLISLNLVVLNVLPIPALDGGRLFFLLIEKIKGSPLGAKREVAANAIGFIVLILLMVLITVRDVVRLF